MLDEHLIESLTCKNRKLVNNCNALKKHIVAYKSKLKHLQISGEADILLEEGPIEYYPTPDIDSDFEEVVEALKLKNADLQIVYDKLFLTLQQIEILQRKYEGSLVLSAKEEIQELPHVSDPQQSMKLEDKDINELSECLHISCQDLEENIAAAQNQKKELEKCNSLNETIIAKLNVENAALWEKVKQLENNVQNLSPVSDKIAYIFMAKTDIEAERRKYKEELDLLLKEKMEVEDLDENLNKQLTRMKDFSNYTNLINELQRQVEDLRDSVKVIEHKKKRKQFLLCKKIRNYFLSESEIMKENVEFLIREKQEVMKKANNLQNELKVVENILTIYGNIQGAHQKELDDLREQMLTCQETLEKPRLSPWQRFLNFFSPGAKKQTKELKEMHTKKNSRLLKKQLEDVQEMLCTYGINREKLKTKISALHEKARTLEHKLMELQHLTLKKQKISKLYI